MIRLLSVLLVVFGVASTASADTITVYLYSDPVGATIITPMPAGITGSSRPIWMKYDFPRGFIKKRQCQVIKSITARWASGAEKTIEPTICGADGKNQAIVFKRPEEAPNRDIDSQFALKVLELELRLNADRSNDAAATPPVTCATIPVGRAVFTRCY